MEIFINLKVTINYRMEQITCFFHPNRDATKKCIKCEKYLCLECQKFLRNISGRAMSDVVFCSKCVKAIRKRRIILGLVGLAFGITIMYLILTFALNKMEIDFKDLFQI